MKMNNTFLVDVNNLHWKTPINEPPWENNCLDNPYDLCLHGDVTVSIGNEVLKEELALNASSLYLLRTLTKDHVIDIENPDPIMPCCGHSLNAIELMEDVLIVGCPNGLDFSIEHKDNKVRITTESRKSILILFEEYKQVVYRFADEVKLAYEKSLPKIIEDKYDRAGYELFWKEWNRRRTKIHQ